MFQTQSPGVDCFAVLGLLCLSPFDRKISEMFDLSLGACVMVLITCSGMLVRTTFSAGRFNSHRTGCPIGRTRCHSCWCSYVPAFVSPCAPLRAILACLGPLGWRIVISVPFAWPSSLLDITVSCCMFCGWLSFSFGGVWWLSSCACSLVPLLTGYWYSVLPFKLVCFATIISCFAAVSTQNSIGRDSVINILSTLSSFCTSCVIQLNTFQFSISWPSVIRCDRETMFPGCVYTSGFFRLVGLVRPWRFLDLFGDR